MEQNKALTTIIEGVYAAQRRGAYNLQEAGKLARAVSFFLETENAASEQKKEESNDNNREN